MFLDFEPRIDRKSRGGRILSSVEFWYSIAVIGSLAQLVRAFASHARGRWFESSRIHCFPGGFARDFCLEGGQRWRTTS